MSEPVVEQAEREAPGREKNRITVFVRHGGMRVTLEPNIHQKVAKLLEDALKAFAEQFNLQPPSGANVALRLGSQNLDPNKSIQEAGVQDKAELDLVFVTRAG